VARKRREIGEEDGTGSEGSSMWYVPLLLSSEGK
jgi:hypothetical protein